jgi:hypothetical protein
MVDNGFSVDIENTQDMGAVKTRYQVPPELQSCHTAIVDGYVIEGHVPIAEVERLLVERPDIIGLGVPGMPAGSPGMETASGEVVPYDVFTFDADGVGEIFASYP